MIMLQCEACGNVMRDLQEDVKYLLEAEKAWKPEDLQARIQASCGSPLVPTGQGKEACGFFLADYHESIATEITRRWTEDDEYFEEGIVPKEFCEHIGICKEGYKNINQMISES